MRYNLITFLYSENRLIEVVARSGDDIGELMLNLWDR